MLVLYFNSWKVQENTAILVMYFFIAVVSKISQGMCTYFIVSCGRNLYEMLLLYSLIYVMLPVRFITVDY